MPTVISPSEKKRLVDGAPGGRDRSVGNEARTRMAPDASSRGVGRTDAPDNFPQDLLKRAGLSSLFLFFNVWLPRGFVPVGAQHRPLGRNRGDSADQAEGG